MSAIGASIPADAGNLFVGVDVGTGSVRAALVDASGTILKTCEHAIKIFEPQPGYYEQSSANIWEACKTAVKVRASTIKKLKKTTTTTNKQTKCVFLSGFWKNRTGRVFYPTEGGVTLDRP